MIDWDDIIFDENDLGTIAIRRLGSKLAIDVMGTTGPNHGRLLDWAAEQETEYLQPGTANLASNHIHKEFLFLK